MAGCYWTRIENQTHEAQPDKLILQSSALAPRQLLTADKKGQTPEPEGGPGVSVLGWRCLTHTGSHQTHPPVLPHLSLSSRRAHGSTRCSATGVTLQGQGSCEGPMPPVLPAGLVVTTMQGLKNQTNLNKKPKVSSFAQIIFKLVLAWIQSQCRKTYWILVIDSRSIFCIKSYPNRRVFLQLLSNPGCISSGLFIWELQSVNICF